MLTNVSPGSDMLLGFPSQESPTFRRGEDSTKVWKPRSTGRAAWIFRCGSSMPNGIRTLAQYLSTKHKMLEEDSMYQIDLNKEQRDNLNIAIGLAINDMYNCAISPAWNIGDEYANDGSLKLFRVRRQLEAIRSRVFQRPFVLKDDQELEIINHALIAAALCIDHLANSFVWCIAGISQEPSVRQMQARSQELFSTFRNIRMEIFVQTEKATGTDCEES